MPSSSAVASPPAETLNAVMRALQSSDMERAVALSDDALASGVETPLLLNLSAFGREERGDFDGALARLARAMQIAPTDVEILTATGALLSKLGRDQEALAHFENALVLSPGHAPAHHGRGVVQAMTGDAAAAKQSQERAVDLDPQHPDAWGALAEAAMTSGDPAEAHSLALKACALAASQPSANMVLAQLELEDGAPEAAERRLLQLLSTSLSPLHRAAVEQLLGETLDALDRPEEAFDAFLRGNALRRGAYRQAFENNDVETGLKLARRVRSFIEGSAPADWAAAGGEIASPCKTHVFLLGFVRSGTTLLEQVLASHPDVTALEEMPTLRAIATPFFEDAQGLERLRDLSAEAAEALRRDYWARVRSCGGDPDGKVFVDKAPLATLWLPVVAKLFPEAKIILAIRDPRDVVVSSFKHRFAINPIAWSFTDLEETAELYSAFMDLAAVYPQVTALRIYQHRHEDLVQAFDEEVARLCDFLDIEPTAAMKDFATTAKRRDIRTPSAAQVRRGLFTEGMGRWRRYGPKTEAMLPIVARWVETYGYAAPAKAAKPSSKRAKATD